MDSRAVGRIRKALLFVRQRWLTTIDLSAYERRFAANDPNIHDLFWLDWQSAALRRAYDEAKVNLER